MDRRADGDQAAASIWMCAGKQNADIAAPGVVDVFYALAGTDVYRSLVRERGWSPEQYEQWLFGLACRELIDQPLKAHLPPDPKRQL